MPAICYSILRQKVAFGCDNLDPPDQLHQWNVISKRETGKVCRMTRQSQVITDNWTVLCCVFTVLHYITIVLAETNKQTKLDL